MILFRFPALLEKSNSRMSHIRHPEARQLRAAFGARSIDVKRAFLEGVTVAHVYQVVKSGVSQRKAIVEALMADTGASARTCDRRITEAREQSYITAVAAVRGTFISGPKKVKADV